MRCVEGWSMVIPWVGLPLARLLDRAEPMGGAKYVAFQTLLDPTRLPGQRGSVLQWPYVEGLRIDEAMHPLTLLAVGLYGRRVAGAERRTAPAGGALEIWVQGDQVDRQDHAHGRPADSTWNAQAPSEYGFFSNVNPNVPHPRWSQATEQRIGESGSAADAPVQRICRAGRPTSIPAWTCGPTSEPAAMIPVGMKRQRP